MPARQSDVGQAVAALRAIGSAEIPRHVGKAVAQTVESARDYMRGETRRTLGSRVRGPGGLTMRHHVPDYTVNAIMATNVEYRSLKEGDAIPTGEVFVAAKQGKAGQDQSAFLKFQFGQGPQIRDPGDVGLSNSRILVWRPMDLVLLARIGGINPYDPSGKQPRGLLGQLGAMARPDEDVGTKADIMRRVAAGRVLGDTPLGDLAHRLGTYKATLGKGALDAAVLRAADRQGGDLSSKVVAAGVRRVAEREATPWRIFRGPDKTSGIQTFKARPKRVRDPAGGTHAIKRADGTVGWMPNMLDVAPEYGEAGRMVGPRALFLARSAVSYEPKLQAPWEAMQARGTKELVANLAAEVAHAVERRDQGRSF